MCHQRRLQLQLVKSRVCFSFSLHHFGKQGSSLEPTPAFPERSYFSRKLVFFKGESFLREGFAVSGLHTMPATIERAVRGTTDNTERSGEQCAEYTLICAVFVAESF